MFTPHEFATQPPPLPAMLASTGIVDLDNVTSGIRERSVWVVVGPPRAGRSTLALQMARHLAEAGVPVRYVLGRDAASEVVARLRAATQRRPLTHCRREQPTADESWVALPIKFDPDSRGYRTDGWEAVPRDGALVVDDVDRWAGTALEFAAVARLWAEHPGRAVVLTVPAHVLRREDAATWQEWVRIADVIVEVEPETDGVTLVRVLSHRAGPVAECEVQAEFEWASLVTPRREVAPPRGHADPDSRLCP